MIYVVDLGPQAEAIILKNLRDYFEKLARLHWKTCEMMGKISRAYFEIVGYRLEPFFWGGCLARNRDYFENFSRLFWNNWVPPGAVFFGGCLQRSCDYFEKRARLFWKFLEILLKISRDYVEIIRTKIQAMILKISRYYFEIISPKIEAIILK